MQDQNAKPGDQQKLSNGKVFSVLMLIVAITYFLYAPARQAAFTNWDDPDYVVNNEHITSFKKYKDEYFIQAYGGAYQPLTMVSYALDYSIAGLNPRMFHLTNLLLHLINCGLVCWLMLLLIKDGVVSLVVTALFAIHPMQVESVAWITERNNVLYALFFLASLISYHRYVGSGRKTFYFLSLVLFVCSILSKGMAISLAVLLVGIDYFMGRRWLSAKVVIEKIPFFLFAIISVMLTIHYQPIRIEDVDWVKNDPINNPLYEKMTYAGFNIFPYVVKLLAPFNLAPIYPYPEKPNGSLPWFYFTLAILSVLALAWIIYFLFRKRNEYSRTILFAILWFIVNIAMVLQLVPLGIAIRADRYIYLPSLGVFILMALGCKWIFEHTKMWKVIFPLLMLYMIGLGYLTYNQCKVWHNGVTLWTQQIHIYPEMPEAYNYRGHAKFSGRDFEGAVQDYDQAILLDPQHYKAYYNKGTLEYLRANYAAALDNFNQTLQINPKYSEGYPQRAAVKVNLRDLKGAVEDYSKYIARHSDNAQGYFLRGRVYLMLNDNQNALRDFDEVLKLKPDLFQAYTMRGLVNIRLNRTADAEGDFDHALSYNSMDGEAYYYRGRLRYERNREQGCDDLLRAAQLGHPEAINELPVKCR